MTDDPNKTDEPDDGPTIEEAKAAAAEAVHEPEPAAAELPGDVVDGEAGDTTADDDPQ